jgi:hypothetical protein
MLCRWFVRCEAPEGLEASAEVVGGDEVGEVLPKLIVAVVVIAFDRRFLDRPVHPLELTIGPGVPRFGQPMLDVEVGAGSFEAWQRKGCFCAHISLISSASSHRRSGR